MKIRWVWFWLCALLGLSMVVYGWLVPAHLRAVDASILQQAGRRTQTLVERGLALVNERKLGAAQLLLEAAREQGLPGRERLGVAVTNLAREHPGWEAWGGGESRLEVLFASPRQQNDPKRGEPVTEFAVRLETREKVLEFLLVSPQPAV